MADTTSGDRPVSVDGQRSNASIALEAERPQERTDTEAARIQAVAEQTTCEDRAQARLRAAEQRDALADSRDVAALARDQSAAARDLADAQSAIVDDRADDTRVLTGADIILRAAEQRRRAARQRAKAAEQRLLAAADRLIAEDDREHAARERRRALVDREMLVNELRREHELRREALAHQQRAEQLARTLQRSLSPPSLPRVAGLDVAVSHEPSAPEEVGGDFYDLFVLGPGRLGFFLGDVCGKGPAAAAITSLARYTMRTAAMLHERPEAILLDLNVALRMHNTDVMQTCTVVYGEIEMTAAATAITLAVGGHPAPLIVRDDGSVHATTAYGTTLGVVDDPAFHTCEVDLAAGDAIVICSDGIFDADLDGARIDEQRLAALLTGAGDVSAQDLIDRLTGALSAAERPLRDDIAIMTMRRTAMR
ncbi:MAG: PP2C family protein-serine/threonine phosphatase [Thermoleophilia bacterium]